MGSMGISNVHLVSPLHIYSGRLCTLLIHTHTFLPQQVWGSFTFQGKRFVYAGCLHREASVWEPERAGKEQVMIWQRQEETHIQGNARDLCLVFIMGLCLQETGAMKVKHRQA